MHEPTSADATWIERSIEQPSAFRELFVRHHSAIYKYVSSRVGPDAADDIVSETFVQAFRARGSFDHDLGDSALPWLLGIATFAIAHHRRSEVRHLRRQLAAAVQAPPLSIARHEDGPGADAHLRRMDLAYRPALLKGLARLSTDERAVLWLSAVGELSYQEIAASLGLPIGTVRSRLNRARKRLRTAITSPEDSSIRSTTEKGMT